MSKNISDLCSKAVPANMTMEHASRLATRANQPIVPTIQDNYIYFTPKGISFNPQSILAHAGSGEGTLRVRYDVCPLGPISIVGKSDKDTVIPFNLAKAEGSTDSNKLPDCCCCVISNCCA